MLRSRSRRAGYGFRRNADFQLDDVLVGKRLHDCLVRDVDLDVPDRSREKKVGCCPLAVASLEGCC